MSTVSVNLPASLQARLEEIAKKSGVSVADLLVEAADKMSRIDVLEKIKQRARMRDTRSAFERVLAAVPDAETIHPDDVIK
jgi:hypothetical protein